MIWPNHAEQTVKLNVFYGIVQNKFLRFVTTFSSDKLAQRIISQENKEGGKKSFFLSFFSYWDRAGAGDRIYVRLFVSVLVMI